MFRANFSTSEPFFKCATLHSIARTSTCNPIWYTRASCSFPSFCGLRWYMSTSLVYRGTLRLVVSPGCFPPIGPWTYDNWHIISLERREGTIPLEVHTISRGLWGALFFSVIALSHSPHTIALPLQYWCGCAPNFIVNNSSYLLGQHISILQSSYLLFAMPTLSPRTPLPFVDSSLRLCQVVGFHGGLFFMSLSRNPWTLWNVDINLCS